MANRNLIIPFKWNWLLGEPATGGGELLNGKPVGGDVYTTKERTLNYKRIDSCMQECSLGGLHRVEGAKGRRYSSADTMNLGVVRMNGTWFSDNNAGIELVGQRVSTIDLQ